MSQTVLGSLSRALVTVLLAMALPASAERMKFEYQFEDGSVLKGELDGTVQPDGDTVLVNAISKVSFASVAYPSVEAAEIGTLEGGPPIVSFTGATRDLAVCPGGFGGGMPEPWAFDARRLRVLRPLGHRGRSFRRGELRVVDRDRPVVE